MVMAISRRSGMSGLFWSHPSCGGRIEAAPGRWCFGASGNRRALEFGRLYGPGLAGLGLSPDQLVIVTGRRDADCLWAMEQGLSSRRLAAVIGVVDDADLIASRRLSLAAAAHRTWCLLLPTQHGREPSAAEHQMAYQDSTEPAWAIETKNFWGDRAGSSRSSVTGMAEPETGPWSGIMRRIVSIWLPQWALRPRGAVAQTRKPRASLPLTEQAEAQPPTALDKKKPLALTATVKNVQQLTAVNEAARAAGLSPGMTLTHARALVPDIATAPADPEADRIGLERLADWCGRYSPSHGIDRYEGLWGDTWFLGDDGLWIDVTGCAHLFGGEQALLADLEHRLAGFGIRHRLGLAETLGAAWAVARCSRDRIVDPGDLRQAWVICQSRSAASAGDRHPA